MSIPVTMLNTKAEITSALDALSISYKPNMSKQELLDLMVTVADDPAAEDNIQSEVASGEEANMVSETLAPPTESRQPDEVTSRPVERTSSISQASSLTDLHETCQLVYAVLTGFNSFPAEQAIADKLAKGSLDFPETEWQWLVDYSKRSRRPLDSLVYAGRVNTLAILLLAAHLSKDKKEPEIKQELLAFLTKAANSYNSTDRATMLNGRAKWLAFV